MSVLLMQTEFPSPIAISNNKYSLASLIQALHPAFGSRPSWATLFRRGRS